MIKIAPSLLACDFSRLPEEIRDVTDGGADLFHLDIMDGHFVPNITFGPIIVKAIRKLTDLPLDAHLMISKPSKYADDFINSGADKVTFHIEVEPEPKQLIEKIRVQGCKVGLSLNPETQIEKIVPFLELVDSVLVMSVNPGFGGQSFIEESYGKITYLKRVRAEKGLLFQIEVDGGVNLENASRLIASGVDVLVAGTAIFHSRNRKETIQSFKEKSKSYIP